MNYKIEKTWKYKDLDCVCLAMDLGHRCGYVRIPEGNRFFALNYSDVVPGVKPNLDRNLGESFGAMISLLQGREALEKFTCTLGGIIDVHGDLTYSDHTKLNDIQGFWVGFDCGHCDDGKDMNLITDPYLKEMYEEIQNQTRDLYIKYGLEPRNLYVWTEEDVVLECEKLAEQIYNQKGNYE